jgi:hypothetical protein
MYSSQFTAYNTSSLPASSQPASSATMLAPPSQGPEDRTREAFLGSLREEPELYNLTRPELENLVSVIVREPGFPKLVGCIICLAFFGWDFLLNDRCFISSKRWTRCGLLADFWGGERYNVVAINNVQPKLVLAEVSRTAAYSSPALCAKSSLGPMSESLRTMNVVNGRNFTRSLLHS